MATERRLVQLAELERASGRGTERILRVARTIADLDGDEVVREAHLDEAAWFRPVDLRLAAREVG
jgi:magnesium chelatase family protein